MPIKPQKIKYTDRDKQKLRIRKRISGSEERPRISVFKSSKHIYAQIVSDHNSQTLVSASTLDKEVKERLQAETGKQSCKTIAAAKLVGIVLASKAKHKNIVRVVFDRNGFVYHGRVKSLADGAREGGLEF